MKRIAIIWTITSMFLVIGLTIIGLIYKAKNIDNIMEKNLIEQVEKYLGLYPSLYPTLGNTVKITNEKLIEEGYDAKLEKGCTGYVIVENENMGFKYKAYITCEE